MQGSCRQFSRIDSQILPNLFMVDRSTTRTAQCQGKRQNGWCSVRRGIQVLRLAVRQLDHSKDLKICLRRSKRCEGHPRRVRMVCVEVSYVNVTSWYEPVRLPMGRRTPIQSQGLHRQLSSPIPVHSDFDSNREWTKMLILTVRWGLGVREHPRCVEVLASTIGLLVSSWDV